MTSATFEIASSCFHSEFIPRHLRRLVAGGLGALLVAQAGLVHAGPGVLTQLPGLAGCISEDGSGGDCADGKALDSPSGIALSPDGRNLYTTSALSDAVAIFARDTKTGAVTQLAGQDGCVSETGNLGACDDGKAVAAPAGLAVSPDGKHVYVASTIGAVAVFARDKNTGALTQLRATDACVSFDGTAGLCAVGSFALEGAGGVTVSPDGKSVYVMATAGVVAFARNSQTGVLTPLPGQDGCYLHYTGDDRCRAGVGFFGASRMVISADGVSAYVGAFREHAVASFARDKTTGALTQLAGLDGCISDDGAGSGNPGACRVGRGLRETAGMTLSKDGKFAYVASVDGLDAGAVAIFARDKKTGVLTQLAGLDGCISSDGSGGECTEGRALTATGIVLSPDGKTAHVASFDGVATLARSKKTGVLTQLPGLGGCLSNDGSAGACAEGRALSGGVGAVVTKDGKFVYVATAFDDAIAAFARAKK
jgi:DNA-binding beta-propeller fold protein YncE